MYWLVQLQGLVSHTGCYDCMIKDICNQLSCLIFHIRCARKVWKPTMKIFILLLCTSIRRCRDVKTQKVHCNNRIVKIANVSTIARI